MNNTFLIFLIILLQAIFLLPLKDRRPQQRQFPWMTALLVASNVLIHIWVSLTVYQEAPEGQPYWLGIYPFMEVPRLTADQEGLGALASLTSTYLHANMSHLLGNMFVLWFFGRKVEDATGPVRFLLLYTLCGFTSSTLNVIVQTSISAGRIPGLGASGAISGIMGAYLFLYSNEKILTLISTWLAPVVPVAGVCFIPLPIPIWLPAWVYIIFNFLSDALWGQLAIEFSQAGEVLPLGVGVFAHLGGALGGMLFIYLFMHPEVFAGRR